MNLAFATAILVFNARTTSSFNAATLTVYRKNGIAPSLRGKNVGTALSNSSTNRKGSGDPGEGKTSTKAVGRDEPPITAKKTVRPTARFVAISALASASTYHYPSNSSSTKEHDAANGDDNEHQAQSVATPTYSSYATRELEQSVHYQSLDTRDRAFARLLVATIERRQGQIDKVIQSCVTKPIRGRHANIVQATLRAGAAQLLFLQTPPFAAIKETVQVLRVVKHPTTIPEPMIKFANGVLRNLSRPSSSSSSSFADIENNTDEEMSALKYLRENTFPQDNIAPWLLQRWKRDWGNETTDLICKQMMPDEDVTTLTTPRIDLNTLYSLRAVMGKNDNSIKELQTLLSNLGDDSILLPQCSIRIGSSRKGDVKLWPGYQDGTWWVQDAASTLPALILTRALLDKNSHLQPSDMNVVDMCSAPGGKTMQLLSAGFGHVTAVEASSRRSLRLVENLKRLNMLDRCQIVVEEGQNWTPGNEKPVHGILLDVPCSATGTGERHPDVLRKSDNTLTDLIQTQEILANHCVDKILDSGGVMVYATCSILREESEEQVQKLIDRGNVETFPIQSHEVPGFEDAIDSHGWLRVLPGVLEGHLQSTDGFFVARLVRK